MKWSNSEVSLQFDIFLAATTNYKVSKRSQLKFKVQHWVSTGESLIMPSTWHLKRLLSLLSEW